MKFGQTLAPNSEYTAIGTNPSELTRFIDPSDGIMKIYNLINTSEQRVRFSVRGGIDPDKIQAAMSSSKSLSSVTGNMAIGSDILAFLGIVLSAD